MMRETNIILFENTYSARLSLLLSFSYALYTSKVVRVVRASRAGANARVGSPLVQKIYLGLRLYPGGGTPLLYSVYEKLS